MVDLYRGQIELENAERFVDDRGKKGDGDQLFRRMFLTHHNTRYLGPPRFYTHRAEFEGWYSDAGRRASFTRAPRAVQSGRTAGCPSSAYRAAERSSCPLVRGKLEGFGQR